MKRILCKLLLLAVSTMTAMTSFAGCDFFGGKDNYNLYMTISTLPTQYAVFNTFLDKTESYMWFDRENTINIESLPSHVQFVGKPGEVDVSLMASKAKDILKANDKAKINFYVDDLSVQFFLDVVIATGFEPGSYKLIILSDGTATYNNFAGKYKKATDEESEAAFDAYLAEYTELYNKYYEEGERYVGYDKSSRPNALKDASFAVASLDYVEYWMQVPGFIDSCMTDLPKLKDRMEGSTILNKQPRTMLDEMKAADRTKAIDSVIAGAAKSIAKDDAVAGYLEISAGDWTNIKAIPDKALADPVSATDSEIEQLKSVFTSAGIAYDPAKFSEAVEELYKKALGKLGKSEFDAAFDVTSPGKKAKNLMIIGGSFSGMGINGSDTNNFVSAMTNIVNDFKGEYNIIYKGHPNYPINGPLLATMEDLGIIFIPYRTPAEIIAMVYDTYLGGYSSTTYLGVSETKLIFCIGDAITYSGGKYILSGWSAPLPYMDFSNIEKCYKIDGTAITG